MRLAELFDEISSLIKGLLAWELYNRGLSQHKISGFLSVTQPMVNRFLKTSRDVYIEKLSKLGLEKDVVQRYVEMLTNVALLNDLARFDYLSYLVVHKLTLLSACGSREDYSSICRGDLFYDPDVHYYKIMVNKIASIPGLWRLIPEVGSNIAYAPRRPQSEMDIIAQPGRIVKSGTTVIPVGEPSYGASKHLARVLLIVSSQRGDVRVAMALANRDFVGEGVKKLGLRCVTIGPHNSEEEFWKSIEKASLAKPDAIIDLGGRGLEPIIYIFATGLDELEETLRAILTHGETS